MAGSVRARHLLARRVGAEGARGLAAAPTLEHALERLRASAYGRLARPGLGLADAQRAVAETALWHARVLAGWLSPAALPAVRAMAAWFELANIDDRLRHLAGRAAPPPFPLGALATAWPLVAPCQSSAEVRTRLAGSPWGDPGVDDPGEIALALRLSWGRRIPGAVEEAGEWAAAATALLAARELFLVGRPASALAPHRPNGIGSAWAEAASLPELRAVLPAGARWVLVGIDEPADLWRGEAAWWRRLEQDGRRLARAAGMGRPAVVGCLALLAVDAWRVSGALEAAARGAAPPVIAALDEIG